MAKINIAEEEHAVLFTGYNTEEVQRLGIDARNCAVLDSACSSAAQFVEINGLTTTSNHWTTEIDSRSNKEIV